MPANYNNSAWFYDQLSRLVYGRTLIKAQAYLLQYVPENAIILIVGGGTGEILEELAKKHPTELQITYVEIAKNMMIRSKKRNTGNNRVIFINDAVENVSLTGGFDVIVTPFLFDNFKEPAAKRIFKHVHQLLKPSGTWLYTDFQSTGKWWQSVLLKSMQLFFKLICGVESSTLPNMNKLFQNDEYGLIKEKTFFGEFVVSKNYQKPAPVRHCEERSNL